MFFFYIISGDNVTWMQEVTSIEREDFSEEMWGKQTGFRKTKGGDRYCI